MSLNENELDQVEGNSVLLVAINGLLKHDAALFLIQIQINHAYCMGTYCPIWECCKF